eukprot:TRINITY_DN4761_c0_g1_i1.p1 TRINITY_DN4761_c0_g1~~TRINITY_DN4761_c0_g1_i1.p1  ORF type:complete len:232 (+),score=47.13 TRINITY_DN4761_c0_g1_i1:35-697(+)
MSFSVAASAMNSARAGHIQAILGPMFSGKTTELLRRIRRYNVAKMKCLVLKYDKDSRYSDTMAATHDKQLCVARPCGNLFEAKDEAIDYDVIGIDEGQFFPDLIAFSEEMANSGKIVIIAALDATFQRKPFGSVVELVPLAEDITKLSAVCMMCFGNASFTKRLGSETEVELIGGADKYVAVCRTCFHNNSSESGNQAGSVRANKRVYAAFTGSADGLRL